MNKNKKVLLITHHALLITLLFFAACGVRHTPDLERIFANSHGQTGKRPLIIIPGILGSKLVNQKTGEVVWPSAFRSDVDGLNLPTTPDLAANRDGLVAAQIVETAKLARYAPDMYVYYELIQTLKRFGDYKEGNWDAPAPDGDRDTFYVFPYDWRRDNVETARELVRRIDALKLKLGRPDLRFNIVAHSMGGLVARYAAMYGDADLPPDSVAPKPDWAGARDINKIFMFGTPNEGSAEAFVSLLDGFSITDGVRRRVHLLNKLTREDAMTSPAIYQLMPHGTQTRFLDENLQSLSVDLYDPATWKRYGWGAINNTKFRADFEQGKIKGQESPATTGTLDELDAYFSVVLARARRFHEALDATDDVRSSSPAPVTLFAFGGDCEETLSAPVIRRDAKSGNWLTIFTPRSFRTPDRRRVTRRELTRAMYEPGDGRVTRASLLGQHLAGERSSLFYNTTLPIAYSIFGCDSHTDLPSNKILQDNALTLLVDELVK